MTEILNVIHKTIYQFLDICGDDEEVPMSDKNKLLLEVNKAICNNLKALEQEPCEDCISRREAIKKFTYNYKGERIPDYDCDNFPVQIDVKTVKEMLRELPPVNPQPKVGSWIPVGEGRLPKEGYSVWVTRITDDNCKYVSIASYQGDCWMDNTDKFNKPNPHKVIAWQPLPKPYEPQESEG